MQLYRELRLKHWATGPPAFCRRPFSWCRAQILHTLLPADMSQWQVARDPNALCLLLLAVCPYFGISTWMFVLLFFLIAITRLQRAELISGQGLGYVVNTERATSIFLDTLTVTHDQHCGHDLKEEHPLDVALTSTVLFVTRKGLVKQLHQRRECAI